MLFIQGDKVELGWGWGGAVKALSSSKSLAAGCLERSSGGSGGLVRSAQEVVEAVVVLAGADWEGRWRGLHLQFPLLAAPPKTDSCGTL